MAKTAQIAERKPVASSSLPKQHLCGLCGKHVAGAISDHYLTRCDVCNEPQSIHASKACANKLFYTTVLGQQYKETNPKQLVSRDVFNDQQSVGLHCYQCKQPCFYCVSTFHTAGMYKTSFVFWTYFTFQNEAH